MYYENESKIIWLRIESNVIDIGPISGLSGMTLTEKGIIQVNSYALKKDYPTYEPIFRALSLSVSPISALAYKPRWSDSLPPAISGINWNQVVEKAIIGAIVGGIIALIAGLRRKKRP